MAYIRTDNFDVPVAEFPLVNHQHRNCIRFLTGRATGAPDSEFFLLPVRLLADFYLRQNFIGKRLELKILTEEIGFVGGNDINDFVQFLVLDLVITKQVIVILEILQPVILKSLAQTPLKEEFRILIKEYSAMLVDKITQRAELLIIHLYFGGGKNHLDIRPHPA